MTVNPVLQWQKLESVPIYLIKVKIKRGFDYTIKVPIWEIIDSGEFFNPAKKQVTTLNGGKIKLNITK